MAAISSITYEEFARLIGRRAQTLLKAASFLVAQHQSHCGRLTRPLLGELLAQSSQVEELLDSYGARNNSQWAGFRSMTAAIKLFSNVGYELLHIQHSIPAYRLLAVEQDFNIGTQKAIDFVENILYRATERMLQESAWLHIPIPHMIPTADVYMESLPGGRLPHDLAIRKLETVSNTVTLLATAFLNLAAECKHALPRNPSLAPEYVSDQTGPISEEKLRSLELRFHNLQSLYDTYVSTTETEVLDKDLPVLRGHISVVLHLLRTARDFAHYYERHASSSALYVPGAKRLAEPEKLLETLLQYSICFVGQFLTCAELLCQNMLRRYTENTRIEVRVPPYRGFHVRPSTLISKLVLHYGSEVRMEMEGETYDARSPLDLFRANEKINARKRRSLAAEIVRLSLVPNTTLNTDAKTLVRSIIMTLADYGKVIIYEQPLKLDEMTLEPDSKLIEQITDEIAKLLAMGKIDIATEMNVTFLGDKRVLEDIRLLAECGYGEDNFGNNIPLPERLKYLRQ
jgi:hypothetical protein